MSSLLRLAPQGKTLATDIEEDVWPRIKEFFTWAAQHPQLMGIALLFAGYIVKKSRYHTLRPGIRPGKDFRFDEIRWDNPRFSEWFVEMPGMDFSLISWHIANVPGFQNAAQQLAGQEQRVDASLSAVGVWLGNTFPGLKPWLEQGASTVRQSIGQTGAAIGAVGFDFTFGDLLLMGGAAALLGPALQVIGQLTPKV